MKRKIVIETTSAIQSIALGKKIASCLSAGMVVSLQGPLGSGKTTFTKGLVEGLFKTKKVTVKSPSFALVNQYDGPFPIYHIDCYRLNEGTDFDDIGIDDFLFSEGVAIIEWPERIREYLPKDTIAITIDHTGEKSRLFAIHSHNTVFMDKIRKVFHA